MISQYLTHLTWIPLVLESPGILLKFWKSPSIFLWSNSLKGRFLSERQHFSGFLCMLNLAVHSLFRSAFEVYWMEQCLYILNTSLGDDIQIYKFPIRSLIRELRNSMSNPRVTVIVLFDSSPFGTC